jgi:hypothetical protein
MSKTDRENNIYKTASLYDLIKMTMPNNHLSEKSNEFLYKVIQQTTSQIAAPVEL